MRAKLADLMAEIDGGVVCKMAAKKHPTLEKEIREQAIKDYEAEQKRKSELEDNLPDAEWENLKKNGYCRRKFDDGRIFEG